MYGPKLWNSPPAELRHADIYRRFICMTATVAGL